MNYLEYDSKRKSLQMIIRMNKIYKGYNSMAGRLSAMQRLVRIAKAEKELASLTKPQKRVKCWELTIDGTFEGCIHEPYAEAMDQAKELFPAQKITLKAITEWI